MARAAVQRRLIWRLGRVIQRIDETPRARTLALDVPDWPGHQAGQHVDVRLTAPDGYQAQRSYSIASAPDERDRVAITVERIEDGEVSPYLVDELVEGDQLELRGPIGGYFVWDVDMGGPLLLIAGARECARSWPCSGTARREVATCPLACCTPPAPWRKSCTSARSTNWPSTLMAWRSY